MRSEVAAEAALEHRSQNSQPGLFLTPETQWDAARFGVSETRLCHPARAAVLEVPRWMEPELSWNTRTHRPRRPRTERPGHFALL